VVAHRARMISALHGGVPRRKATPVSLARPHTEVLLPICWSYVLANVEVELPFAPLSALCVSRYALSPISACIRNMGTIRGGSQDPSPLVWLLEQKNASTCEIHKCDLHVAIFRLDGTSTRYMRRERSLDAPIWAKRSQRGICHKDTSRE
jgi:hypothetical protein